MPEIVYYVATSIDGFIATPDGGIDWLHEFEIGDEDYGYAEFYAGVDALLIGRTTYEQVLTFGAWPYEGKPTWVFTHDTSSYRDERVTFVSDPPAALAARLDEAGIGRVWLVGGGKLAGSFAAAGLITTYIVSVMPVLLGKGVPLLGSHDPRSRLVLDSTTSFGDVIQNVYRQAT